MEGDSRNGDAMKLQDFIVPRKRDRWFFRESRGKTGDHTEEDKDTLELTLGPPGEESRAEPCKRKGNQGTRPFHSLGSCPSSYLQLCPGRITPAGIKEEDGERKGASFLPPPVNTAVQNNSSSQKRSAPSAVVGWPPIRSFRRNIASSASGGKQPGLETQNVVSKKAEVEKTASIPSRGSFVKINMDGVPIGRKVDLKSCESYEKLATSVDELFRVLLAAQTDSSSPEKPITGLLDGTGEYTLVYEDYEGDRMLVGDVPWQMFVATVKRLRVLKRSDLSVINMGGSWRKQDNKLPLESASK